MPKTEAKKIFSELKKNEIHNIYYIYGQNTVGADGLVKAIIRTTTGDYSDFSLTKIEGKSISITDL